MSEGGTERGRSAFPALRRHGGELARRTWKLARAELALLALIAIICGGLWAFVSLADEIREGETLGFDQAVMLALRNPADPSDPLGPVWFESVMRDVTALGSQFVLVLITASVIGYLLLSARTGAATLVFFAVLGGSIIGDVLKLGFERPRPDLVPHAVVVHTTSFPSNHAMLSAVTYLTLGVLLARLQSRWTIKAYFIGLSVLLTAIVGLSRVYLGVHWPTDVLAGWSAGAAWAMAVWFVAIVLQRRGKVEPPTTGAAPSPAGTDSADPERPPPAAGA